MPFCPYRCIFLQLPVLTRLPHVHMLVPTRAEFETNGAIPSNRASLVQCHTSHIPHLFHLAGHAKARLLRQKPDATHPTFHTSVIACHAILADVHLPMFMKSPLLRHSQAGQVSACAHADDHYPQSTAPGFCMYPCWRLLKLGLVVRHRMRQSRSRRMCQGANSTNSSPSTQLTSATTGAL